jgi:hypothetical protein
MDVETVFLHLGLDRPHPLGRWIQAHTNRSTNFSGLEGRLAGSVLDRVESLSIAVDLDDIANSRQWVEGAL